MLIAASTFSCLSEIVGALYLIHFFTALGAIVSLAHIYRFANFIWIYCVRPSSIRKYIYGPAPYALVTGASDGIGKALAFELYDKGFNLILHGRSEEKIKKVIGEIRAKRGGDKDIRYFLADGTDPNHDFEKTSEGLKGLHITLVVHNAGGGPKKMER
jgi:17beta-estradiol 17-dehydrogenase / very-long-chain 3-oxoacyl-CoA reductase